MEDKAINSRYTVSGSHSNVEIALLSFSWNASSLEKNHLIASGLVRSGAEVMNLNLCYKPEEYQRFKEEYGNRANYIHVPGVRGELYKGKNKIAKLLNNLRIAFLCLMSLIFSLITSIRSLILSTFS